MTWVPDAPPPPPTMRWWHWLIALPRLVLLAALILLGLALYLAVRLIERPLAGGRRPVTARIQQEVCRATLAVIGLRVERKGAPMHEGGALVANHASWLDIFVLVAGQRLTFVAKAEVAGWAVIGWLARATGTLFIRRDRKEAGAQVAQIAERVGRDELLLFFPEGTSTDGRRVLPFKATLFAAFLGPGLAEDLRVQPIALRYTAPPGEDPRAYGWFGAMGFAPHFLWVLGRPRQGRVEVRYGAPIAVREVPSRKALAAAAEAAVRGMFEG
ncbi:lysophospholipid acyltransferase family protein [Pseudoroseicyclus tamaricis]|uniref:1-acyl-sn-glycerol-3-phosphate acyltransferase n=1 Tax=Pseudoroseicyclus tamaricis TaxID=2705421 RepID=A0A6B2JH80_9RHOB|nr:lysophospholipid acyltransferase family protein [Pseudoroseicyclus tamaricis]NDV00621.1 1-acyl-sn-glycerol-3-phosphate acyltransferase [Pseudoroseicyclus tamaricis]